MGEDLQSSSALPDTRSTNDLVILYTSEAQEWAAYLQQILKCSKKFSKTSILLYAVSPADEIHGYNFDSLQNCKCIVVLVTAAFLDNLRVPDLRGGLQSLLCPPHRVVALLCGVEDDPMLTESFSDWQHWRKLHTEDEPSVYLSTIWESVSESRMRLVKVEKVDNVTKAPPTQQPPRTEEEEALREPEETEKMGREETVRRRREDEEEDERLNRQETGATDLSCLTVQPNRVCCGALETIFIIFKHKIDHHSDLEVEFSAESANSTRIGATVENSFTLSVTAPDFPAGVVSLTLRTNQSSAILKPVTYFTHMGEVSRFIENATDPVNFICQAFHLQSNTTESLDTMLTECLMSKMPATGLQLFGIRQIEQENMASCQRNEEVPTLLHFAAKYGLKKLTAALLHCPGALQAYSVMNKNGDYPNTLAQKSGFSELRLYMDRVVETADMLKSHIEENISPEEGEVYEKMTASSQDIIMRLSGCSEDIYESMLEINPECAEDLYEVMAAVDENPEEAMLRKFFQANSPNSTEAPQVDSPAVEESEFPEQTEFDVVEEEEDPYDLSADDIYDIVVPDSVYPPVLNRPPAPVPRPDPEPGQDQDRPVTYISRVFSDKSLTQMKQELQDKIYATAQRPSVNHAPVYDPYGGMKTPGQRQLISLQERVKVREITVEEAVREFKAWQFDHDRRANSIRYQQENLKKLRDSITRRHKEKEKIGQMDYEISAPLQTNLYWSSGTSVECAVYESTPRTSTLPPSLPPPAAHPAAGAGHVIKRGSWKNGSTSSNSSTESNRLSTHSTMSYSSGTEPEIEDSLENLPVPPRPLRLSEPESLNPPRVPPRIPERVSEKMLHERYISCPTRALPQVPQHQAEVAPPVPRRQR